MAAASEAPRKKKKKEKAAKEVEVLDPASAMRRAFKAEMEQYHQAASQTWSNAESELVRALRAAKQNRQSLESWRESVPSPLRRSAAAQLEKPSPRKPSPRGASSSEDEAAKAEKALARTRKTAAARDAAFAVRAQRQLSKAADFKEKSNEHMKRRLRMRITDLLDEVRRRQGLQQSQAKERTYGENADQHVRWAIGKASDDALGLSDCMEVGMGRASPRRACLVKNLTLEEHQLLRKDPLFFLGSQAPSVSAADDEIEAQLSVQALVDFFLPDVDARKLGIREWVAKLHQMLEESAEPAPASAGESEMTLLQGASKMSSAAVSFKAGSSVMSSLPYGSTTDSGYALMPCLGRHPSTRADEASPTLQRAKEVHRRKQQLEAEFVQKRTQAVLDKEAEKGPIVEDARRAILLQAEALKEYNIERRQHQEMRKATVESEARELMQNTVISRMQRVVKACESTEAVIEEKRARATASLELWQLGMERAAELKREEEMRLEEYAVGAGRTHQNRLEQMGAQRQAALDPPPLRSCQLKKEIHDNLVLKLREEERQQGQARAEALAHRLAAADRRREMGSKRRYDLLNKAFGPGSDKFDHKFHCLSTDRRGASWFRHNEGRWQTQRSSSEPSLANTWSPS